MLHEPATKDTTKDNAIAFKTRIGIVMFAIYGLVYASFVGVNLVKPSSMEKVLFAGLNLSVLYGFGLIILALVMALVYNHLCTAKEFELNKQEGSK
jgi:uncharacterized membrane protein (DUF485 family)